MHPLRSALDRALQKWGMDVIVRRTIGGGATAINIDAPCRARVRSARTDMLVGGVKQIGSTIVLSPTGLYDANWPGGLPVGATEDIRFPLIGDWLIIMDRIRRIEGVDVVLMENEAVRINVVLLGAS